MTKSITVSDSFFKFLSAYKKLRQKDLKGRKTKKNKKLTNPQATALLTRDIRLILKIKE